MGRHTAEPRSDRGTRTQHDLPIVSERRAAMNRTRTTETPVLVTAPTQHDGVAPTAPVSVAANRVSDARVVRTAAVQPDGPRAVRRRRPVAAAAAPARTAPRTTSGFLRARATIPALSFFAVFGFVGGSLFNTMPGDMAQAATTAPVLAPAPVHLASQQFSAHGTYATFDASRDAYDVTKPAPKPVATPTPTPTDAASTDPTSTAASATMTGTSAAAAAAAPAATPDPGSAQAIGQQMVAARGWGNDQFSCLVSLWNKEAGWRVNAYHPSGAYGSPQSLPGSKMASVGADWQTNPATQITWGLNYIAGVYGTPCGAWAHSVANNWY